jgi:hypothetical protein
VRWRFVSTFPVAHATCCWRVATGFGRALEIQLVLTCFRGAQFASKELHSDAGAGTSRADVSVLASFSATMSYGSNMKWERVSEPNHLLPLFPPPLRRLLCHCLCPAADLRPHAPRPPPLHGVSFLINSTSLSLPSLSFSFSLSRCRSRSLALSRSLSLTHSLAFSRALSLSLSSLSLPPSRPPALPPSLSLSPSHTLSLAFPPSLLPSLLPSLPPASHPSLPRFPIRASSSDKPVVDDTDERHGVERVIDALQSSLGRNSQKVNVLVHLVYKVSIESAFARKEKCVPRAGRRPDMAAGLYGR